MAKVLVSILCVVLMLNIKYSFARTLKRINLEKESSSSLKAVAAITGFFNGSNIQGTATFSQQSPSSNMVIRVSISGLPTGQGMLNHGLHVHQFGINNTSDNVTIRCGSSGPHFNPENYTHGDISDTVRHVGDYGNVQSDNNGNIIKTFEDPISSLYGDYNVLGRTIVLHQNKDDLGRGGNPDSLITGNSGSRVACGVIQRA